VIPAGKTTKKDVKMRFLAGNSDFKAGKTVFRRENRPVKFRRRIFPWEIASGGKKRA